jgi:hypothetical protein
VNWVARLKQRSTEVTEVLAEVGLIAEAVFMERSDRGDYLLIYTMQNTCKRRMQHYPVLSCRWSESSISSWLKLWT